MLKKLLSIKNIKKALFHPIKACKLLYFYALFEYKQKKRAWKLIRIMFPNINQGKLWALIQEGASKNTNQQEFSSGRAGYADILALYSITRILKPEIVIETGVASGRSSAAILEALKENNLGHLYSIELPLYYPIEMAPEDPSLLTNVEGNQEAKAFIPEGKTPGWLIPPHLKKRWTLILGKSEEELPKLLKGVGVIDLFFHDSEHTYKNMTFEFKTSWPALKEGGILISDDVHWNKAFDEFVETLNSKSVYAYSDSSLGAIRKQETNYKQILT